MKRILVVTLLGAIAAGCASSETKEAGLIYPVAKKDAVVDDYAGTKVTDPYRWMEALDSKEVADWVAASNAVTEPYLETLPLREHFSKRLTELWNYPRVGLPVVQAGKIFYARNAGLQRQAPIYVRTSMSASPTLVIDPNEISADGSVSLAQWMPSPDAKLFAYGLAEGGADWRTIRVRDLESGKDLPDEIKWMRFSDISWTKDSKGFYYSRYPEPPKNKVLEAALSGQAVYYHRVGTPQSQDVLIYERKDLPAWIVNGSVSEDGRYLFVLMFQGAENRNRLYVADLGRGDAPKIGAPIRPLEEKDDAEYLPLGNHGSTLYVRSDKNAPNRTVLSTSLAGTAPVWKTVVPERKEAIENVGIIGGRLVAQYLADVQSRLSMFGLDGASLGEIALPGAGTVGAIGGRADSDVVWYGFTSPLAPSTVYAFDLKAGKSAGFEAATPPVDASAVRDEGALCHVEGRHACAALRHHEEGPPSRRQQPDDALRVRRVLSEHVAGLSAGCSRVARAGRRLGHSQYARRGRVRRSVAPGRHAREETERLR